jgi:hypothetical protein
MLDFDKGKTQYDLTIAWAKSHKPIKLEEFQKITSNEDPLAKEIPTQPRFQR